MPVRLVIRNFPPHVDADAASAYVAQATARGAPVRCETLYYRRGKPKTKRGVRVDVWWEIPYHEADGHRCGASRERLSRRHTQVELLWCGPLRRSAGPAPCLGTSGCTNDSLPPRSPYARTPGQSREQLACCKALETKANSGPTRLVLGPYSAAFEEIWLPALPSSSRASPWPSTRARAGPVKISSTRPARRSFAHAEP